MIYTLITGQAQDTEEEIIQYIYSYIQAWVTSQLYKYSCENKTFPSFWSKFSCDQLSNTSFLQVMLAMQAHFKSF